MVTKFNELLILEMAKISVSKRTLRDILTQIEQLMASLQVEGLQVPSELKGLAGFIRGATTRA